MKDGTGGTQPDLVTLASPLAPRQGYNATAMTGLRILRSETVLSDVPVLYRPGAVFVLQGEKRGLLDRDVFVYDADHYLAVAVPVPFRMHSTASPQQPLLALYVDFDLELAAEIATQVGARIGGSGEEQAKSLVSSPMDEGMRDMLRRLLTALGNAVETEILGPGLMRELHYRVLVGPQGGAMRTALRQSGPSGRVVKSLGWLRENCRAEISVADLAAEAGMSVPSYHARFRQMTGTSPMQYAKAMRLHDARTMIARADTIASVAAAVGYASPAQFSRDFKRHFGRTATDEIRWMREHIGETG